MITGEKKVEPRLTTAKGGSEHTNSRTLQLPATPNDHFRGYQSTPEPPKSAREPLKAKEATERWNVAFLGLPKSDVH